MRIVASPFIPKAWVNHKLLDTMVDLMRKDLGLILCYRFRHCREVNASETRFSLME